MRFFKKLAILAVAVTFLGAPLVSSANEGHETREPSAAKKKKTKKAKGKAGKAKKGGKKAGAKRAAHAPAKHAAKGKSHAPAHGAAPADQVPDPYSDVSNDKKDDLPPPANTEPKDE